MERENAWKKYGDADIAKLEELAAGYIDFISTNKTERECCAAAIEMARAAGYVSLAEARERGAKLKPGDKVYADNCGKSLMLVQVGELPMERGFNILGAHIDSPRLDIKQNPLYESADFALLDTHYYGGIKKYQWVTIPLAIHGVVCKTDGTVERVNVGEDAGDPAFVITDLLPHLGDEQMKRNAAKVVEGEDLDVLVGSRPLAVAEDDESDEAKEAKKAPVKAKLLALLKEKYGMAEEDFLSAELEVVPAGRARECGFDRSMVLGYGQDDRSCAYTSLVAQLDAPAQLQRTGICLLVDKEEIGSVGATGMTSMFFENTVAEIMDLAGQAGDLPLRRALANSAMLSSDVSAGFDPLYGNAFEAKNAAYLGRGLVFNKFTGARGKSGSNDANAEYVAQVRRVMEDSDVAYQTAELGKVD
ncbi:MAG: aminopeptidase, partial [Coriobacteriaceae bacterium]|nr:aminopeptidase [Coriobacteriaceae bacterium]